MATPAQIAADHLSACRPRACNPGVWVLETQVLSKSAKPVKTHLRSGGIEEKSRIAGTCRDEEKRHDPTEQEPLQLRRIVPHVLRGRGASAGIAG